MIAAAKVYTSLNLDVFSFFKESKNKKINEAYLAADRRDILYKEVIELFEKMVLELFTTSEKEYNTGLQTPKTDCTLNNLPELKSFIKNVTLRTKTSISCIILALLYLARIKANNPGLIGSTGSAYRLIISSLCVATKYLYDDAYHNYSWVQVCMGLFELCELNQMENEFMSYLQYQLFVSPNEWNQWVATIEARLVQTWKENGVAELLWKREVFLSNECCSRSVSSTVSNVAWSSKGKILLDSFSRALGSESKIGYSSTHKSNASITGKKFYVNIAGKTKNNSNGKDRVFFSTSNLPSRSKKMNSIKNLNFFRSKKIEDVEMAECCQDNSSDSITVDICTQPKRGRALVKLKQSFSSLTKMAGNGTTTCNQVGKKPRICNEREYIELSSPIYSTTRRAFNSTNHSKSSANIKSSSTSSSGVMSDSQTIVIM